jgi:hypothetical protein
VVLDNVSKSQQQKQRKIIKATEKIFIASRQSGVTASVITLPAYLESEPRAKQVNPTKIALGDMCQKLRGQS